MTASGMFGGRKSISAALLVTPAILTILVIGSAANQIVANTNNCVVGRNMALSLGMRTNDTGHQQVKARLEQPADSVAWHLDVELKTPSCVVGQVQNRVLTLTLNGSPQAPPGYFLLPGFGFVRPSRDRLTFDEARLACAAEGSSLAMPSSLQQAKVLVGVILYQADYAADWAWIGATDVVTEGKWISLRGVPLEQMGPYTWFPGTPNPSEPNGGRTENCMVVNKATGFLGDAPCTWKVPYVCQYDV